MTEIIVNVDIYIYIHNCWHNVIIELGGTYILSGVMFLSNYVVSSKSVFIIS